MIVLGLLGILAMFIGFLINRYTKLSIWGDLAIILGVMVETSYVMYYIVIGFIVATLY